MTRRRSIPRSIIDAIAGLLLVMACVGMETPTEPQEIDAIKAAKVKAACLFNFVNLPMGFVEWPQHVFARAGSPIVIGVVGKDPFGKILDDTMKGKVVGGRRIVIKRYNSLPGTDDDPALPAALGELKRCHLLFLGAGSERRQTKRLFRLLANAPVLTVSDISEFAEQGGMIELALVEGRLKPRINRRVVERAKLRMSSKLLKLATIVESRP